MIIGISMDEEMCLILRGETDKTASDIQARSFMARTLERNVKER